MSKRIPHACPRAWSIVILLLLNSCFGGDDSGDLVVGNPPQQELSPTPMTPGEPGALFTAVVGEEFNLYRMDGRPFTEPLEINLISERGWAYHAPHRIDDTVLKIRVPIGVPSGLTRIEVREDGGELSGDFLLKRLGVIANAGARNLIVFDADHPETVETLDVTPWNAIPEDVVISADGRLAHAILTNNDNGTNIFVTLDLTQHPPQFITSLATDNAASSTIRLLPDDSLAVVTNSGSEATPGDTIALYELNGAGIVTDLIDTLAAGEPNSGPYDLDVHAGFSGSDAMQNEPQLYAVVTHRYIPQLSVVGLAGCALLPRSQCARAVPYAFPGLIEPTGVAIMPQGNAALVADYATNQVHRFTIDGQQALMLSESLALDGGDQGPVALRITAGGGRGLVLNEESATLSLLDLTQDSPLLVHSFALHGVRPGKITLSFNPHGGNETWITFTGSHEVRKMALDLFLPRLSPPLPIPGLNKPRGIAIQP